MPDTLVLVSGALFSGEGKILLLRRALRTAGVHGGAGVAARLDGSIHAGEDARATEEATGDCWELPGGALEFGEAPESALIRCFAETTGLDISVDRPLGAWSEIESVEGAACHRVHIDFTVTLSAALLSVECDPDLHSGFAWLPRTPAVERISNPGMRASVERAFAVLARARKNG